MRIGGIYSFNGGKEAITQHYQDELAQVYSVIQAVDANRYKTKTSFEKTMPGRSLFHPKSLNLAYRQVFTEQGWRTHRVYCDYPTAFYTPEYTPGKSVRGAFREMDFVKNRVGVDRAIAYSIFRPTLPGNRPVHRDSTHKVGLKRGLASTLTSKMGYLRLPCRCRGAVRQIRLYGL